MLGSNHQIIWTGGLGGPSYGHLPRPLTRTDLFQWIHIFLHLTPCIQGKLDERMAEDLDDSKVSFLQI